MFTQNLRALRPPPPRAAKGPVTLGYGLTRSHVEGAKAPHRESAPVSISKRR